MLKLGSKQALENLTFTIFPTKTFSLHDACTGLKSSSGGGKVSCSQWEYMKSDLRLQLKRSVGPSYILEVEIRKIFQKRARYSAQKNSKMYFLLYSLWKHVKQHLVLCSIAIKCNDQVNKSCWIKAVNPD